MFLHANTITSLELFGNQTDFKPKGSLFWLMDHTRTPFGSRLLRKWIGAPLVDREQLELRAHAVQELMRGFGKPVERVLAAMRSMRDLERDLAKVYFGRCGPRDLYYLLVKLRQVGQCVDPTNTEQPELFKSDVLNTLFAQLVEALEPTEALLAEISEQGAQDNDKTQFFMPGLYESIETAKTDISSVESALAAELETIREATGLRNLAYITNAGIPYLLEVEKRDLARVPLTWTKISQYRTKSRFRSPETTQLVRELDRAREQLTVECNATYQRFLSSANAHYLSFRTVVRAVAELDCLMALAAVSSQPHYVRPEFVDTPCVELTGLRHPMAEQQLLDRYVANDCSLSAAAAAAVDGEGTRALVLTGPNMGGKSSYVRAVALACIMAQVGSHVPATRARLGLLDAVHTRMGAHDNLMAGESTFMVELKEVADIMRRATSRSLVLLDEVGRGTGTMDGVAIGHAVLEHFVRDARALTIFVTHFQDIAKRYEPAPGNNNNNNNITGVPAVRNYHMGFLEEPGPVDGGVGGSKVTFLYTVEPGLAPRSYGLNVARLARLPEPVLAAAARKSRELEREIAWRRLTCRQLINDKNNHDDDELRDRLLDFIKLIDQV